MNKVVELIKTALNQVSAEELPNGTDFSAEQDTKVKF
jgi:hypothetical protein